MAIILGDSTNNKLLGTTFPDLIAGQGGNDQLSGLGGNDRLIGGLGNDTLNGGAGIDTADYSSGRPGFIGATAGVTVSLNVAGAQNTGGAGVDTLVSIENLTGTNFNDILTGNSFANTLSGLGGDDTLSGGSCSDVLNGGSGADTLNGGTGADAMYGGDQDDTYIVDNESDTVVETSADSPALYYGDTVQSSMTYTLGYEIESLTLTGVAAINGTGNGENNVIIGNDANNVLMGLAGQDNLLAGSGNDLLIGGAGQDDLSGGSGNDTFKYNGVSESADGSLDFITNFQGLDSSAGDQIDLTAIDANAMLGGNQAFTYVGEAEFGTSDPLGNPFGVGELKYNPEYAQLRANTDADAEPEFAIYFVNAPALFVSGGGGSATDILL